MLNNSITQKIKLFFVVLFSLSFLISCSNIAEKSQNQTQILIEYALYDFPLPSDSEIQMDNTVILGSGDLWAGQIILLSDSSPVELIKFFTESAQSSGWTLGSSTISEMVLLVFNNDDRIATVEISKVKKSLFSFSKTKVKIAINHPNSIKEKQDTIAWHAKQRGVSSEEIVEDWKSGQSEKVVWKNFCNYCSKYHVDKKPGQWFTEPVPSGYNIINFDIPIARRLAKKYKTKLPFSEVSKIDMMDILFMWFENLDEPSSMKLDAFRKFFGMKAIQAHEALSDTIDEAELMVKFIKFHRRQASVGKFKGAFAK